MKSVFNFFTPSGDVERNLPPVILLHGLTDSRLSWNQVGPEIAAKTGRKVYALDARNHGDSGWTDEFDFSMLADDLEEFMTDHKIPKAVLIGHSMGGKQAMSLAVRKAELVEKLIVEDMHARTFSKEELDFVLQIIDGFQKAMKVIPKDSDERIVQAIIAKCLIEALPKGFVPPNFDPNSFKHEWAIKKQQDGSYEWKANLEVFKRALTRENEVNPKLMNVYMGDALFLYGTKSMFKVDEDESNIKKHFPRASLVPVEGSDHDIHTFFPKEFVKEVVDFIN